MSQPAAFQRSMARLALLAMLALTLLPGIGRIAQSRDDGGAAGTANALFGAICTTEGLVYDTRLATIEAIDFALDDRTDAPAPAPPPHGDHDCDYCALASANAVPAAIALHTASPRTDATPEPRGDTHILWHYPRGLGSRGPPLTA